MSRFPISKREFNNRLLFYVKNKIPFTRFMQGSSRILKVGSVEWYCYSVRARVPDKKEDRLPANEIGFIGKVKTHIKKYDLQNSIKPLYKDKEKIKFIDWNRKIGTGEYFDNCFCIDINSAYWKSAFNIGYVDKKLFDEGLTKDKRVRLACLGTFAKVIDVYEFDGETERFNYRIDAEAEQVFFNPAFKIYQCMNECKLTIKSDFLFYWTDCVYVKNKEALAICKSIMEKHGFESKVDKVERIIFSDDQINAIGKENDKGVVKNKKYRLTIQ